MRRPIVWIAVSYIVCILAWFALHPLEGDYHAVDQMVHLRGTVRQVEPKKEKTAVLLSDVSCQEQACKQLLVYGDSSMTALKPGNVIQVQGNMVSFSLPGNPGQFNEYVYYKQNKIDYRVFAEEYEVVDSQVNGYLEAIQVLRTRLCQQVEQALPEREAGILCAMLFGDKSGLSEEVREQYQQNGIAHLLAISGLHVSILGVGVFNLLRRWVCKMKTAAAVTMVLLLLYGELTGFSLSTSRAVVMMFFMLTARLVGRAYDGPNAMAISALIQLVPNPLSLFSMSFLFSYGNAMAIYWMLPFFDTWFKKQQKAARALGVAMAIFLINIPLCLHFYGQIITYSPVINFLVLPVLSILVVAGLGAAFCSILIPVGKSAVFGIVYWIFRYYDLIMNVAAHLPQHIWIIGHLPLWRTIVYLGTLIWMVQKRKWSLISVLVLLVVIPVHREKVEITFLDVGQGDGIYVTVEGTNIIIDGGSSSEEQVGKYRILPYLQWRGVRTIHKIFLSHGDSDHINGIEELLAMGGESGIEIQEVILPKPWSEENSLQRITELCERKNIPVSYMEGGEQIAVGEGYITCLHPTDKEDITSENDNSLVLQLQYENFSALFTGDLETEVEGWLLASLHPVEVLKVAHHGSKGATSEQMLTKLKPRIAVVSAGKKNRYGHPHQETIERLRKAGTTIYSTIPSGAITITSDGTRCWVSEYRDTET